MNGQLAIPVARPMSPWFDAALAKYGSIAFGVIVGTTAKWALVLAEGRNLTLRMVAIDFMLAPFVAMLTYYASAKLGMASDSAGMMGALFAVASDRVVRLVRVRFLQKMDIELQAWVAHQKGLIREEVQAEMSGKAVINDTITGNAPTDYKASKTRRLP